MGAIIAVFSILESLVLRPLPVREPEQLVFVGIGDEHKPLTTTFPVWNEFSDHSILPDAVAWSMDRSRFAEGGQYEPVDVMWVSGRFFDVLGISPVVGRAFFFESDRLEADTEQRVAVLSYGFWRRRFGGSATTLGTSIDVEGIPFTVIGVTPPAFFGPEVGLGFDVIIPLAAEPVVRGRQSRLDNPYWRWLRIMARLTPDQTPADATMLLRLAQPRIRAATLPAYDDPTERDLYLRDEWLAVAAQNGVTSIGDYYRKPVLALAVTAGMVLLIACGNMASMLVTRTVGRQRELGVRAALGATRFALVRQLLVESVVVCGFAATLGLALGYMISRLLLIQLSTSTYKVSLDVSLNWRIAAFTAATGLVCAVLCSVAPARRSLGLKPSEAIKARQMSLANPRLGGAGAIAMGVQISLSFALIVVAGFLIQAFVVLASVDLGFRPAQLLIVEVETGPSNGNPGARTAAQAHLLESVMSTQGVSRAAISAAAPLGRFAMTATIRAAHNGSIHESTVHKNVVTPGWFQAMGTALLAGRDFGNSDRSPGPLAAIVNRKLARQLLGDTPPLGRTLRELRGSALGPSMEIVGIVEDAVYRSIREPPPPTIYIPLAQVDASEVPNILNLVVRLTEDVAADVTASLAGTISGVDRELKFSFKPMMGQVRAALNQEKVLASLAGGFAALGLVLASFGLYSGVSFAVESRHSELAIRIALGASRGRLLKTILLRFMLLTLLGLGSGWLLSVLAIRSLHALLAGLPKAESGVLLAAAVSVIVAGAFASWAPARRAVCVEPAAALREG